MEMEKYTKLQRFAVFLSRLMMIHNVVMDVASFCGYNVATTIGPNSFKIRISILILWPKLFPEYSNKSN